MQGTCPCISRSLFFCGYPGAMLQEEDYLSEAERNLRERFDKDWADKQRLPSDAVAAAPPVRIDHLVLPDEMRPKMPLTKDKYLVRENPHLVAWEREVRKFLRNLSPDHGHRVSAVMVYEWATGLRLAELQHEERRRPGPHPTYRSDLIKINKVLAFYFGKPYMTWIGGRKVPKAYRVKGGYYIRRHRPMTLTLYTEYIEGTLYP